MYGIAVSVSVNFVSQNPIRLKGLQCPFSPLKLGSGGNHSETLFWREKIKKLQSPKTSFP